MANVGEAVRRERERLGLSQVELAVRMGFPRERQSYVSGVERGIYIPNTLNLLKFAEALAVDIQQLVSPLEVGQTEMNEPARIPT